MTTKADLVEISTETFLRFLKAISKCNFECVYASSQILDALQEPITVVKHDIEGYVERTLDSIDQNGAFCNILELRDLYALIEEINSSLRVYTATVDLEIKNFKAGDPYVQSHYKLMRAITGYKGEPQELLCEKLDKLTADLHKLYHGVKSLCERIYPNNPISCKYFFKVLTDFIDQFVAQWEKKGKILIHVMRGVC